MLRNYRISYVPGEGLISIRHFEGCTGPENLIVCANNQQVAVDCIDEHEREVHGYVKKDNSSGDSEKQEKD